MLIQHYHMSLFNAYGLLRKAYNGIFKEPTGVKFTVKITANKNDSFEIFDPSLHAVIVRLLSNGLNEAAILNRLYEEQIKWKKLPGCKKYSLDTKRDLHNRKRASV